tara:strand:- start:678 stop:878 length:201 start_codon:yes stop_codon:yes gene_type:complete
MTDDLVARLREAALDYYYEDIIAAAADRIEALQDIIAKIQYTNLRRDINAESRTIEIDRMCKEKIK